MTFCACFVHTKNRKPSLIAKVLSKNLLLVAAFALLALAACTPLASAETAPPTAHLHPALTLPASAPSTDAVLPISTTPAGTVPPALAKTPQISPTGTPSSTPEPTPLVFAVIGDFGLAGQPEADVAALVSGWNPALIITTGDNNLKQGSAKTIDANIGQYYHQYIHPYAGEYGEGARTNRFFPTLGNHDWDTDHAQPYLNYFELPGNERYYDFIWGPVHFFALDSDSREPDGVGRSSIQAQWLRTALANSASPWNVVYFHHPPYSSANHGDTDWMQWPFARWGADIVISAHDHVYERLFVNGLTYLTVGTSGNPNLYGFDAGQIHPGSQVRYRDDFGALRVEVTETEFTFSFISRSGKVIDSCALPSP